MSLRPHRVALVVDRNFGNKLIELSKHIHVWICESSDNQSITNGLKNDKHSLESGVTTFKVDQNKTAEELCVGILPTIDEHHGQYSHTPPWSIIEVYGVEPTPKIKTIFIQFGATKFETIDGGFRASRTP